MTATPESAGTIGFLTAPGLLRDLHLRKATGQLVACQDETIKKVYFKSGYVLYAVSNLPADRLGDVLLARGMISRDQYEESASQVIATGRKQGTVLVQIGALAPKDLFRGLIAQVRDIVVSLCGWDRGTWQFLEGLPPQDEIVSLRLQPAGLVFEGLALIAGDPRWSGVWDPQRLALHPAAAPPFPLEQIDTPDDARRLLALVEQGRTPQEMARQIGRGDADTAALLYGLALLGLIEARPQTPRQPQARPPAAAREPTPAARDESAIRAVREKLTSLHGRLPTLSHYQLLGVGTGADRNAIKSAYIALAKEFHPDRYFRPEFQDLQEAVNGIFLRISEAFATLSNPAMRAAYDLEVVRLTAPAAREKAAPEDSHVAKVQYSKGLDLLNSGDVWSAIQALRWAVNLAPQNPRYHTWLGVALMRTKKRLHEAEEHCKTAIALDYNNPQYYVHLGQVYRTGHLFDKAKKQFETALRLDPKHPGALKEIREMEPAPDKGMFDRFLKK
jgi:hypothetical protein